MNRLFVLLPATALLAALAQVLIKLASRGNLYQHGVSGRTVLLLISSPHVWLSAVCYLVSFLLTIKIFESAHLSSVAPAFMGLVLVFVVIISCAFLGERLSLRVLGGQLVILLGIYLVLGND